MPKAEFKLIDEYFRHCSIQRPDTIKGIGDDAALISIPENQQLVTRMSQWLEGRHFNIADDGAETASSLLQSALEAFSSTGTQAKWMTLSITLQEIDESWLRSFSQTLIEKAHEHEIQLIGGDTSAGPGCIRLHLIGFN